MNYFIFKFSLIAIIIKSNDSKLVNHVDVF